MKTTKLMNCEVCAHLGDRLLALYEGSVRSEPPRRWLPMLELVTLCGSHELPKQYT